MSIRDIINRMDERLSGEEPPEQDQEEYLDRLGVEEDTIPERTVDANGGLAAQTIQGRSWVPWRDQQVHQQLRSTREPYDHGMDTPANYQQRLVRWSNGDMEGRQERRRPRQYQLRSYGYTDIRRSTSAYVHDKVREHKINLVKGILHDVERLVWDFYDRTPYTTDERQQMMLVESMVDHYLEDIGDDILMRHKVYIRQSDESFSLILIVTVEVPGIEPLDLGMDLHLLSDKRR